LDRKEEVDFVIREQFPSDLLMQIDFLRKSINLATQMTIAQHRNPFYSTWATCGKNLRLIDILAMMPQDPNQTVNQLLLSIAYHNGKISIACFDSLPDLSSIIKIAAHECLL
jgi:hypothetical protein